MRVVMMVMIRFADAARRFAYLREKRHGDAGCAIWLAVISAVRDSRNLDQAARVALSEQIVARRLLVYQNKTALAFLHLDMKQRNLCACVVCFQHLATDNCWPATLSTLWLINIQNVWRFT